ncbi:unnamed protein product [Phytophthora lilii]|uniref:Unnamed protein product n=1 Tax=Phytophthora lilii TaxID=2077276 RepID=A0A9W7CFR7_9STRA|nr:unnamed protein product [Phytophthora lilii]
MDPFEVQRFQMLSDAKWMGASPTDPATRYLGIPIGDGLKATVAFLADDTVLFSKGKVELQKQLKLVDSYCVGSGAKLNQSKSVIMSLNNRCPPPRINPLRSLHRGETVRYLGIPFGNCDTLLDLANDLDRKLITKLRLWKDRARTLLGRKLIVQTLILSLLWYFTSAMIIPNRFINRWQAMISQFVLYNRIGTGKRGVNVVKTEFALTPKDNDGIGIPNVKIYIRRQHLQLLQVFVRAISSTGNHDEEIWYRPMQAILQQRYGNFSRQRSFDFLMQNPPPPPGWKVSNMPLWWRKVLQDWNRIKWP